MCWREQGRGDDGGRGVRNPGLCQKCSVVEDLRAVTITILMIMLLMPNKFQALHKWYNLWSTPAVGLSA
jgi:hypothetical protein